MATMIVTDKLTPEQAYEHWRERRPDFFVPERGY
jgi:hypothetical protein